MSLACSEFVLLLPKKMLAWPYMALARPEVFFQKRLLVALAQKEQISSSFYDSLFYENLFAEACDHIAASRAGASICNAEGDRRKVG